MARVPRFLIRCIQNSLMTITRKTPTLRSIINPLGGGADLLTYNIPGVTGELNFTPEALAAIFLGKVTKWNDPIIASANKGVNLPANEIVVVHRSDGSGTSYIWTDYLCKVSDEW